MWELSLADPVPVHDDPVGLVAPGALVEHHQVLFHLNNNIQIFNGSKVMAEFSPLLTDPE